MDKRFSNRVSPGMDKIAVEILAPGATADEPFRNTELLKERKILLAPEHSKCFSIRIVLPPTFIRQAFETLRLSVTVDDEMITYMHLEPEQHERELILEHWESRNEKCTGTIFRQPFVFGQKSISVCITSVRQVQVFARRVLDYGAVHRHQFQVRPGDMRFIKVEAFPTASAPLQRRSPAVQASLVRIRQEGSVTTSQRGPTAAQGPPVRVKREAPDENETDELRSIKPHSNGQQSQVPPSRTDYSLQAVQAQPARVKREAPDNDKSEETRPAKRQREAQHTQSRFTRGSADSSDLTAPAENRIASAEQRPRHSYRAGPRRRAAPTSNRSGNITSTGRPRSVLTTSNATAFSSLRNMSVADQLDHLKRDGTDGTALGHLRQFIFSRERDIAQIHIKMIKRRFDELEATVRGDYNEEQLHLLQVTLNAFCIFRGLAGSWVGVRERAKQVLERMELEVWAYEQLKEGMMELMKYWESTNVNLLSVRCIRKTLRAKGDV